MKRVTMLVLFVLLVPDAIAQQTSIRLESKVMGNRELPRVMYIVPWRQPGELGFDWQPEPGIAGELFQPLRRDEYLRRLQYQNSTDETHRDVSQTTENSDG